MASAAGSKPLLTDEVRSSPAAPRHARPPAIAGAVSDSQFEPMKWTFTLPLAVNFQSPAVISTAAAGAAAQAMATTNVDPQRSILVFGMTRPPCSCPYEWSSESKAHASRSWPTREKGILRRHGRLAAKGWVTSRARVLALTLIQGHCCRVIQSTQAAHLWANGHPLGEGAPDGFQCRKTCGERARLRERPRGPAPGTDCRPQSSDRGFVAALRP